MWYVGLRYTKATKNVLCNENLIGTLPETSNLTTYLHKKAGMCVHTALNDGLDSQKGKSLVTTSAVCCLQDRNAAFHMDSKINIVRQMYIKMLQKIQIFFQPSVPWFLQKSGHNGDLSTIHRISPPRAHRNLLSSLNSVIYTCSMSLKYWIRQSCHILTPRCLNVLICLSYHLLS